MSWAGSGGMGTVSIGCLKSGPSQIVAKAGSFAYLSRQGSGVEAGRWEGLLDAVNPLHGTEFVGLSRRLLSSSVLEVAE